MDSLGVVHSTSNRLGTRDDVAEFAMSNWGRLVRVAVMLGARESDAHDLAQETLIRAARYWKRVRDAANPQSYLYRILVNLYRDRSRRRWQREVPYADVEVPEVQVAGETSHLTASDVLDVALRGLTADHRAVLVLRFYGDLSVEETAGVLQVPPGTVKSRTARALDALAQHAQLSGFKESKERK